MTEPATEAPVRDVTALCCRVLCSGAAALARRGRHGEAEQWLELALGSNGDAAALALLGKVYAQQGKFAQAVAALEQSLRLDPDRREAAAALRVVRARSAPVPAFRLRRWRLATVVATAVALLAVAVAGLRAGPRQPGGEAGRADVRRGATEDLRVSSTRAMADVADLVDEYTSLREVVRDFQRWGSVSLDPSLRGSRHVAVVAGTVPSSHLRSRILQTLERSSHGLAVEGSGLRVSERYTVREGDTLTSLAVALCGDGQAWNALWEANRSAVVSPDHLLPGMDLVVSCP